MALNTGYVQNEVTFPVGLVRAIIYYDPATQTLINGPRGFCLDLTNTTGANRKIDFTLPDGTVNTINVTQGDPVRNRSLTVGQVNALGYINRSDVSGFTISG